MKQYTPQPAAEPASPEQMRAWVGEAKEAGEAFYALVDEYKHTASLSADDVMLFNERTYRTLATVRDYYELYVGHNQTVIDLPDTWKFKIDPEDQGQAAGWAATDCSDADWDEIRVDAFWETQGYGEQDGYPGLPSEKGTKYAGYNGIAWYRLSDVRLPEDTTSETLVSLRLGAVDEDAWVYVNGQLCGTVLYDPVNEPDGWKLPRLVPIGGAILRNAANTIAVRVRDTIGGGGIWQGTALVLETPDAQGEEQRKIVFLEDFEDETLHIETHSNSVAQVVESDGQKVLRVVVKNPYPDQAFSKSWIIPVDSDREYVASFRYRSANVVENREFKQRWRRTPVVPQVRMFSTDILGKVCQPVSDYVWFGGEFQENVEDWTLVRRVFRTPEAAASLRLTLFLHPKGEYFIDNVCVETF